MQWIVALVIGLLILVFSFFFIYKFVWNPAEGVGDFTPDEVERAKEQCELECASSQMARNCEVWRQQYCEKQYLTTTCGASSDVPDCEAPSTFGDGSKEDCDCKYLLVS